MKEEMIELKLTLVGDASVGKTSVLNLLLMNKFNEKHPTVGVDIHHKIIDLPECQVKLYLWDTAGQERFRCLTNSYFRGSQIVMLIFDVTNGMSLTSLAKWLQDAKDNIKGDFQRILVGNKMDLITQKIIPSSDIEQFISQHQINAYFMVSAKNDLGEINIMFNRAAQFGYEMWQESQSKAKISQNAMFSYKHEIPVVSHVPNNRRPCCFR